MEGRIARLAHRAVDRATHLSFKDKNNVGDGLIMLAGVILLYVASGLNTADWANNLGSKVALGMAALSAASGATIKFR